MPGQSGDHEKDLSGVHDSSATRSAEDERLFESVKLDPTDEYHRLRKGFASLLDGYFSGTLQTRSGPNRDPYARAKTLFQKGTVSLAEVMDFFSAVLKCYQCPHEDWMNVLNTFPDIYLLRSDTIDNVARADQLNFLQSRDAAALESLVNFVRAALESVSRDSRIDRIYYFFTHGKKLFDFIETLSPGKEDSIHKKIYDVFANYKDPMCEWICSMDSSADKADIIERALSKKDPLGKLFWHKRGESETRLQAGTLARLRAAYEPRKSTRYQQPEAHSGSLLHSASTGDIDALRAELRSANPEIICPAMFVAIRNPGQGQSLEVLRALFSELKRFPEWVEEGNSVTDESRNTLLMQAVLFQNEPAMDFISGHEVCDESMGPIDFLSFQWPPDLEYRNNDGHTIRDVAKIALSGRQLRAFEARLNDTLRPRLSSEELYQRVTNANQQALAWSSFSFTGSLYSLFCRADNQPPEAVDRDVDSDEDSSSHGL